MKKYWFYIVISVIVFISCQKESTHPIDNVNDKKYILGHGGMGVGKAQYPLDSYEGIEKAVSLGADGSEIDVQMTKDSVLVCFHDSNLEDASDESGEIYTKLWDEIKNAEYRTQPYKLYKICKLEQVFQYNGGSGNFYTFDLKLKDPDSSPAKRDIFQRALIRLIEKFHLETKVTIESSDESFLKSIQDKKAGLYLFIYSDFESALQTCKQLGLKGMTVKADEVSAEQIKEAHSLNIMVAVFSATHRNHDEIIHKNVDIIQTDDLKDLVDRLK